MKTLTLAVIVLGLGGPAAADEKVVLKGDDRTYKVEVISADPSAKTLTIRSGTGSSTLRVDDEALTSLQGAKPGDKITITLRDEATGRRQAVSAVVSGTISGSPTSAPSTPAEQTVLTQAGAAVEVLNIDPATKKVTVIGEGGSKQVLHVDDKTLLSLADVKPGQTLFVSYRFDRNAKPEAVVRVGAGAGRPVAGAPAKLEGAAVEVISTDPASSALTIRAASGEPRTLVVDELALVDLQNVRAGDTVLLKLEGDRVLVITRQE